MQVDYLTLELRDCRITVIYVYAYTMFPLPCRVKVARPLLCPFPSFCFLFQHLSFVSYSFDWWNILARQNLNVSCSWFSSPSCLLDEMVFIIILFLFCYTHIRRFAFFISSSIIFHLTRRVSDVVQHRPYRVESTSRDVLSVSFLVFFSSSLLFFFFTRFSLPNIRRFNFIFIPHKSVSPERLGCLWPPSDDNLSMQSWLFGMFSIFFFFFLFNIIIILFSSVKKKIISRQIDIK